MPPIEAARRQLSLRWLKGTGAVCLIIGVLWSLAWGFRVYILYLTAQGDQSIMLPSIITALSLGVAAILIVIGTRTLHGRNRSSDAWWLIGSGCWISAVGLNRLTAVLLWPSSDPNPRAHLHLAVSFIVMGTILLLLTGRAAWRRRLGHATGDQGASTQGSSAER
jgi:hypothetical protein